MFTKLIVVCSTLLNLLFCFWLRSGLNLSLLATVGISMGIGMAANLALDNYRGVGNLPKLKPTIEQQP